MRSNSTVASPAVFTFDQSNGKLTSLNAAAQELLAELELSAESGLSLALIERRATARGQLVATAPGLAVADGETRELRRTCLLEDGRTLHLTRIWSTLSSTVLLVEIVEEDKEAEFLRRQMSELLAAAGDAILSVDADQNIILFNRQAETMFGYEASEIVGQPLDVLLPKSIRGRHRRYVASFRSECQESRPMSGRPEIKGRRKDGSEFPAEAAISKIELDGSPIFTAVIRDLTVLREAEEQIRKHEAQLRAIIEELPFGVAVCRPVDGHVLFVNTGFAELIGEPVENLLGASLARFYDDPAPEPAPNAAGSSSAAQEILIRTASGERRWVVNSVVGMTFGGEDALLCACYDVTDRRQALEALHKSRRSLAKAQQIAQLGSWNWDVQLDRLDWSDEAYRIFEMERGPRAPTYDTFRAHVHPDDLDATHKAFQRSVMELEAISIDLRLLLAGGRMKYVHIEVEVECDESGRVRSLVGTIQDTTEMRRAEQELRRAKEEADTANRAKSMFLANMSHELRTPLNAILGYSEIMANDILGPLDNERRKEYAHNIHCSGRHLLEVVNDILDLSRIEAGRVKLNEAAFSPVSVIDECLGMVAENAAAASLMIERRIGPNLPLLYGDERLFKQVMLNLLSNAIKFTPEKGYVEVSAAQEKDGTLRVIVMDNGIGIAPGDIPKLLKPFAQIESHLSRRFQGTGLGLALSSEFLRLHGGTLTLESQPGQGTSVIVDFPAERVIDTEPEQRAAAAS